jgi:ABC-type nitrate/sulfonate/bicarbonate transport system substrate-binding protein
VRRHRSERKLVFGVVYPVSTHHLQLRHWLLEGGIDPENDVRIVVVPPGQMVRNLAAGTIDGCCVGEPWNTLAAQQGVGRVVAWSSVMSPGHIEKVLMVRSDFARSRAHEHERLVAALVEAAAWCDEPANRVALAPMLARPEYLNLPEEAIAPVLTGATGPEAGLRRPAPGEGIIFHHRGANRPERDRAVRLVEGLVRAGLVPPVSVPTARDLPGRLFREDIHLSALKHTLAHEPTPT